MKIILKHRSLKRWTEYASDILGHNLCPWVSPDNLRMYYHNESGNVFKLMLSERYSVYESWPVGESIEEINCLGSKIQGPALTEDELTIFFDASDISGGKGGYDIWMASRPDKYSDFTHCRNLYEINTDYGEHVPFVSSNGLELYFSSNRNGQQQLFKATRSSLTETFGNIEHLSQFDTRGENITQPCLAYDGSELYFMKAQAEDRSTRDIYVSYYYPNAIYVDAINGDDSNNGMSPQTAFATIQNGVNVAPEDYTILVSPGIYTERIDFNGKAITIQGQAVSDGIPVLEAPDDFAVTFADNEGPDSVLKNFVIRNSNTAVFIASSSPTIRNVTIVDNIYGIRAYAGANPGISNCIFCNNLYGDLSNCISRYSLTTEEGEGNIFADPLFVDPDNGDYHLRSERGRYWPEHNVWVLDNATSPCVDAGDPMDDPSNEPIPNGGFINMGTYGGTRYASMSEKPWPEPDVNHDGIIDTLDLEELVNQWLAAAGWIE